MTNTYLINVISQEKYTNTLEVIKPKLKKPIHFLQAPFYGHWQELSGKKVLYFDITRGAEIIGCGMAIRYPLPGGFWYYYCPYGPLVIEWLPGLSNSLIKFFKALPQQKLIFTRLDADNLPKQDFTIPSNHVASTASLQPRNEWALDITSELSVINDSFYKTARYHVRLAQRNNTKIRINKIGSDQLDVFYDLMKSTSNRNDFGIMPKSYYQAVFKALQANDNAFLGVAEINGVVAAVALIITYDNQAHYVFGCSSDTSRKIAPSYLLQLRCIEEAKARGCTLYNFGGISDDIKSTHLKGVTDFKKRFGGYQICHNKPVDIVKSKAMYRLFSSYKRSQHILRRG